MQKLLKISILSLIFFFEVDSNAGNLLDSLKSIGKSIKEEINKNKNNQNPDNSSNPSLFQEKDNDEKTSNIKLTEKTILAAEEKTSDGLIIQTVISEGIGETVQAAAQNAAQNALTNVVGSFVDSTKLLEKRTQIKDGIKSQTKNIKSDIKEYSQGSIRKFEIIETTKENGLFKVTAKASIVIEDFKVYIKKLAESENTVEQGLFAAIETEDKQNKNVLEILRNAIAPAISGEVMKFEIGKPELTPKEWNLDNRFIQQPPYFYGDNQDVRLLDLYKFKVDFTRTTDGNYIDNFKKTLRSIAKKEVTVQLTASDVGNNQYEWTWLLQEKLYGNPNKKSPKDNSLVFLLEGKGYPYKLTAYQLPIAYEKAQFGCEPFFTKKPINKIVPEFVIELLDSSGSVISEMYNSELWNNEANVRNAKLGPGKFISTSYGFFKNGLFSGTLSNPFSLVGCIYFSDQSVTLIRANSHTSNLLLPITDKEKSAVKIRGKLVQQ
jgi:hypothetical protein